MNPEVERLAQVAEWVAGMPAELQPYVDLTQVQMPLSVSVVVYLRLPEADAIKFALTRRTDGALRLG